MTHSSRIFRPFLAVAVVLMMVCVSLTAIFATTGTQAAFATLEKGDKWALQEEETFVLSLSSSNGLLNLGDDDSFLRNATIDNVLLNANVGMYVLFEVTDVNETAYVIKVTAAESIALVANLSMTGEFVEPGSYLEWAEPGYANPDNLKDIEDALVSERTLDADIKLAGGSQQTALFTIERSTMNVTSISVDTLTYLRGNFSGHNIPQIDSWGNSSFEQLNITSYDDYSMGLVLDLHLSGIVSFIPGIAFIADALPEHEEFESEFLVNGTLNWSGVLDITGLPNWLTEKMFTEDVAKWGVTGFPVDLAKIYNPGSTMINNGTMAIDDIDRDLEVYNYANRTINDPVFGTIQVQELGMTDSVRYLYCPENGRIVGAEVYAISDMFRLKLASAPVADVEKAISGVSDQVEKKQTYDQIMNKDEPEGLPLEWILVAVIAVIAVVAVGGFLYMRKKKPAT